MQIKKRYTVFDSLFWKSKIKPTTGCSESSVYARHLWHRRKSFHLITGLETRPWHANLSMKSTTDTYPTFVFLGYMKYTFIKYICFWCYNTDYYLLFGFSPQISSTLLSNENLSVIKGPGVALRSPSMSCTACT